MGQPSIAFKGLFEDSHRIHGNVQFRESYVNFSRFSRNVHGNGLIREFSVNRKLRGSLNWDCPTDIAVTDEADRD